MIFGDTMVHLHQLGVISLGCEPYFGGILVQPCDKLQLRVTLSAV